MSSDSDYFSISEWIIAIFKLCALRWSFGDKSTLTNVSIDRAIAPSEPLLRCEISWS